MIIITTVQELARELEFQLEAMSMENGAGTLLIRKDGRVLRCRVRSTDRLACEIDSIQVSSADFEHVHAEEMSEIANRLAERLTYLEELLTVVEHDRSLVQTQIRSAEPRRAADNATSYFELMVARTGLHLHRYQKRPSHAREVVSAVFTRNILGRLSEDLLSVARFPIRVG